MNFYAEHLAKLEPGFNAEVSIYNDEGTIIILSPDKPTGKFEGYNFKIKSNNNAMVYFYGKNTKYLIQTKIDPNQIGKNFEFKAYDDMLYIIDFGFEGYNPSNILCTFNNYYSLENGGNIFIENVYDKLKTKLPYFPEFRPPLSRLKGGWD